MKRLVFLFLSPLVVTVECCAQGFGDGSSELSPLTLIMLGLLSISLVLSILFVIPFLWFRKINKKFKAIHPQYERKYLWSLLFFPCFYIVLFAALTLSVLVNIIDTEVTRLYGVLLVGIIFFCLAIYLQKEINKNLFNWDFAKTTLIKIMIGVLVCLSPLFFILYPLILGSYKYFVHYDEVSNTTALITYVILGGLIWYFAQRKLQQLALILSSNNMQNQKSTNTQADTNGNDISMADKLIELKNLLDTGALTEEEFNKLKRQIIDRSNL